jgi:hypothetical protein
MEFSAKIFKIGINPYILVPQPILKKIFAQAGKDKGHIPISVVINDYAFIQNLVKYSGKWRLYLNTSMRKIAGKDVGDIITINVDHDPNERKIPLHPKLKLALDKNKKANNTFNDLPAYRKKEILRYINSLKTDESVERNIKRAINFLLEKERFIGRERP